MRACLLVYCLYIVNLVVAVVGNCWNMSGALCNVRLIVLCIEDAPHPLY